jgi:hypothetical protein
VSLDARAQDCEPDLIADDGTVTQARQALSSREGLNVTDCSDEDKCIEGHQLPGMLVSRRAASSCFTSAANRPAHRIRR